MQIKALLWIDPFAQRKYQSNSLLSFIFVPIFLLCVFVWIFLINRNENNIVRKHVDTSSKCIDQSINSNEILSIASEKCRAFCTKKTTTTLESSSRYIFRFMNDTIFDLIGKQQFSSKESVTISVDAICVCNFEITYWFEVQMRA